LYLALATVLSIELIDRYEVCLYDTLKKRMSVKQTRVQPCCMQMANMFGSMTPPDVLIIPLRPMHLMSLAKHGNAIKIPIIMCPLYPEGSRTPITSIT